MLFNSLEYLFCFIPLVFIVYFALNKLKFYNASKIFLLCASLYFYGSYKWDYVYIIIVSILFNYGVSLIFKKDLKQSVKKAVLISALIGDIGILIFFKYFSFLAQALSGIDFTYLNTIKIIMPLGISFFIIQQISYIIDCYKDRIKETSFIDYSLFVCFFPQLIAGPIVRHSEMIPQFNNIKNKFINQENIYTGLFLITAGLLKKTVLADGFAPFIKLMTENALFDNFYTSWLLGAAKVMQGYFDFSGYCDMALGSAFLFNISLPWNFNSPFHAENITDFWKRWNMTLIRFLRTYIYNPLGSDKGSMLKTCRNIIIVFTVMGLWIGFSPISVFYGILNGLCICINKFWQMLNIKMNKFAAVILTFITVVFTSQFLTAGQLKDVLRLFKSMLCINADISTPYIKGLDLVFAAPPYIVKLNILLLIGGFFIIFFFRNSNMLAKLYSKSNNIFYTILTAAAFIFGILSITKGAEFIYFAF